MTGLPTAGSTAPEARAEPDPHVSIVIPVFNEAENILPLWNEIHSVLAEVPSPHEVIFVDDGSTDGTGEALRNLRPGSRTLRVLRLPRNSGQSAAMLAGFRAARGAVIVTLDGDRQNDPADIRLLLERLPGFDAVVGYRRRRKDGPLRRLASRLGNSVRNLLTGDDIIDTGCTLKAFRRECVERIPVFDGMHRFLPTLMRMEGFRVRQVPVSHRRRPAGASKYGIVDRLLPALGDLLAVRWMKTRRIRTEDIEEL